MFGDLSPSRYGSIVSNVIIDKIYLYKRLHLVELHRQSRQEI